MSLLSEHKYVYPEHIKPLSQIKQEKQKPSKKLESSQIEMGTSCQSFNEPDGSKVENKLTKDNETTPALQSYIRSLANK